MILLYKERQRYRDREREREGEGEGERERDTSQFTADQIHIPKITVDP